MRSKEGGIPQVRIPRSKHFQIQRLEDGVYAVIASERGYAICNAGIVDAGGRTIVFDTFISPDAAKDLFRAARLLTPKNSIRVVNSHYHNDHIRGNQVFPSDVDILSTATTREEIAHKEPEVIKWEKQNIPKAFADARSKLNLEKDSNRRRDLAFSVAYCKAILESHPKLKMRLPNINFKGNLMIHGTRREVELLSLAGHTASDIVLYLPEERIAFMSDLLFINGHPYLASGSPERWKKSLSKIGKLGVQTLVPGHGPVGQSSDLSLMFQYIQSLETIARNMVKMRIPAKDTHLQPVPQPFDTWLLEDHFVLNLEFLHRLLSQETS
jgi:cyclase